MKISNADIHLSVYSIEKVIFIFVNFTYLSSLILAIRRDVILLPQYDFAYLYLFVVTIDEVFRDRVVTMWFAVLQSRT